MNYKIHLFSPTSDASPCVLYFDGTVHDFISEIRSLPNAEIIELPNDQGFMVLNRKEPQVEDNINTPASVFLASRAGGNRNLYGNVSFVQSDGDMPQGTHPA